MQTATHLETFWQERLLPTKEILTSIQTQRVVLKDAATLGDVDWWDSVRKAWKMWAGVDLNPGNVEPSKFEWLEWIFLSITYPRQDSLEVGLTTVILQWEWNKSVSRKALTGMVNDG